jgi:hypothetical protein
VQQLRPNEWRMLSCFTELLEWCMLSRAAAFVLCGDLHERDMDA